MRGKAGYRSRNFLTFRITPAYAGKSYIQQFSRKFFRDHPRLCGEKSYILNFVLLYSGSPPPMRGKGDCQIVAVFVVRDHPRLCGEKLPVLVYPLHVQGSPPPMRGKAGEQTPETIYQRITPAYAGKSFSSSGAAVSRWDHPRLCGEKFQILLYAFLRTGSPPPMRGKVEQREQMQISIRITPAYAGKRNNTVRWQLLV